LSDSRSGGLSWGHSSPCSSYRDCFGPKPVRKRWQTVHLRNVFISRNTIAILRRVHEEKIWVLPGPAHSRY
jgi:hypothetical protein